MRAFRRGNTVFVVELPPYRVGLYRTADVGRLLSPREARVTGRARRQRDPDALKEAAAAGRKPNSVPFDSPLSRRAQGDDHSSSPAIAGGIKQPTRKLRTGRPIALPYLALLRAGFCLPPVLPRARCALTAPFHHCLSTHPEGRVEGLCIFCATFLQVTLTGRYPAHCPSEFGLSSRLRALRALRRSRLVSGCGPPVQRACLAEAREASESGRSSGPLRR
jgi:hypothetical protein